MEQHQEWATICPRKRVNLHPTRYWGPFSREKGQFVSKTRIRGPLVSSAGTIGTSITSGNLPQALPQAEFPKVCFRVFGSVCQCLGAVESYFECGRWASESVY